MENKTFRKQTSGNKWARVSPHVYYVPWPVNRSSSMLPVCLSRCYKGAMTRGMQFIDLDAGDLFTLLAQGKRRASQPAPRRRTAGRAKVHCVPEMTLLVGECEWHGNKADSLVLFVSFLSPTSPSLLLSVCATILQSRSRKFFRGSSVNFHNEFTPRWWSIQPSPVQTLDGVSESKFRWALSKVVIIIQVALCFIFV